MSLFLSGSFSFPFMKLYRNVYLIKTMCRIQLWLLFLYLFRVMALWLSFMLFYEIHILLHPITHSLIIVSSYNLIGMCIRYRRRVPCKNECTLFLVSKWCAFDSFFPQKSLYNPWLSNHLGFFMKLYRYYTRSRGCVTYGWILFLC